MSSSADKIYLMPQEISKIDVQKYYFYTFYQLAYNVLTEKLNFYNLNI